MRQQPNIVAAAVLAAAIATAATASAQTAPGTQAMHATVELAPRLSEKPYSDLFDKQPLTEVKRPLWPGAATFQLKVRPNSARRFICGMPVLPADSSLDPKFEVPLRDTATRFAMRLVPTPC